MKNFWIRVWTWMTAPRTPRTLFLRVAKRGVAKSGVTVW
jgi:hypothetical protein